MGIAFALGAAACGGDSGTVTSPSVPSPAPAPPPTPTPAPAVGNMIAGSTFWVDPLSNARRTAGAWRASRPADASQLDKIAEQGMARWIGNWNTSVRTDVDAAVTAMSANGALPVLVAFNIPQRDCGGLSGGNSTTIDAYRSWITAFAAGLAGRRAAVILEPDALAGMDCLSAADRQVRLDLLNFAVRTLTESGNVAVYLDAGHPRWQSAATMAQRLVAAGVAMAQGFSLNVSNFVGTSENESYGSQLSGLLGGKHFVIDTGRNGLGPTSDNQWCNPAGRALGARATPFTGNSLVDAYLWIKTPGESDGACNGAPASGVWMPDYALGLAQRAAY
ncbi:MAG: glycoside hydrolase family 6 protein [Gemmatimonadaceae bacterium]|nr:glycoside hydrolase family 6 protein [Gemmatimonadaceae bacterium]